MVTTAPPEQTNWVNAPLHLLTTLTSFDASVKQNFKPHLWIPRCLAFLDGEPPVKLTWNPKTDHIHSENNLPNRVLSFHVSSFLGVLLGCCSPPDSQKNASNSRKKISYFSTGMEFKPRESWVPTETCDHFSTPMHPEQWLYKGLLKWRYPKNRWLDFINFMENPIEIKMMTGENPYSQQKMGFTSKDSDERIAKS